MPRNHDPSPRSTDAGGAEAVVDAVGGRQGPLPDAPATGTLVKRKVAAKLLGVSESTVRRMEGSLLNPIVAEDGVHMFRAEEVVTMRHMRIGRHDSPKDYDGPTAARVFALLDEGLHPVEIVKRTSLDPRVVTAIYEAWASMLGGFVVQERHLIEFESILWLQAGYPMKSADELVAALKNSSGGSDCLQCKTNPADYCAKCVDRFTQAEQAKRLIDERAGAAEASRLRARGRGNERAHVSAKRAEARRATQQTDVNSRRRAGERVDAVAREATEKGSHVE